MFFLSANGNPTLLCNSHVDRHWPPLWTIFYSKISSQPGGRQYRFSLQIPVACPFPIILTIELRMIIVFRARNPISSEHRSFWYSFLQPHQTTYHSNIDFIIRKATRLRVVYLRFSNQRQVLFILSMHLRCSVSCRLTKGWCLHSTLYLQTWDYLAQSQGTYLTAQYLPHMYIRNLSISAWSSPHSAPT